MQRTRLGDRLCWTSRHIVDLGGYPEIALRRPVALSIQIDGAVQYSLTGKRLGDFFRDPHASDLVVRRNVSSADCADLISEYYQIFLRTLR